MCVPVKKLINFRFATKGRDFIDISANVSFGSSLYVRNMWDLRWTKWRWNRFCSQNSVFPCQYHSTIAPYSIIHLPPTLYNIFFPVPQFSPVSIIPPLLYYSIIHLPPTLYNVFLPVLQFSPVSIIPPLLHTQSSIYHPRCIMFFSQYLSFPLSVSFHHCYITQSSIYHPRCLMFFSQYFSFPLSVSFHHCSILNHPSTTHAV